MSIAKVMELSAESPESLEHAIRVGIKRASATVDHIQSAWVKEQNVKVEDGKITSYRVNMKVTFILKD